MVGSEEEEKNWKGIVIALVVIGAILGLIATAIVIVTPGKSDKSNSDMHASGDQICVTCNIVLFIPSFISYIYHTKFLHATLVLKSKGKNLSVV